MELYEIPGRPRWQNRRTLRARGETGRATGSGRHREGARIGDRAATTGAGIYTGRVYHRRDWLKLLALSGVNAWAQGVSTRSLKPTPRGKPSGLPFHAK